MLSINYAIISIIVIVVFFLSLLLPKFWKYVFNGTVLTILGILGILYNYEIIDYNILIVPIFHYVILVIIGYEAKNLISEGVHEHKGVLRKVTISMGIFLICMVIIPELYKLNILPFDFPELPVIITYIIYVISGLIVVIGAIATRKEFGEK